MHDVLTRLNGFFSLFFFSMVEDRYANLLDVVRTRAVISVGLSCFRRMDPTASGLCQKWVPQTFDVSVLCDEEYIVEPGSLKFLTEHGFDFNSQYAKGLPFKRGNDRVSVRMAVVCT